MISTIYAVLYTALAFAIVWVIYDYAPLIRQWRLAYVAKRLPGAVHQPGCTCWLCKPPKLTIAEDFQHYQSMKQTLRTFTGPEDVV